MHSKRTLRRSARRSGLDSPRRLPANAPAKSARAVKSGHLDSTKYELKYEPLETAVEKTVSPQGHSLVALLELWIISLMESPVMELWMLKFPLYFRSILKTLCLCWTERTPSADDDHEISEQMLNRPGGGIVFPTNNCILLLYLHPERYLVIVMPSVRSLGKTLLLRKHSKSLYFFSTNEVTFKPF